MRSTIVSIILLCLFASCNNSSDQKAVDDSARLRPMPEDTTEAEIEDIQELDKEDFYVWQVDSDQKTIRKNPKLVKESIGVDSLIIGLNEMYPKVQLEKVRQGHDTLYTQIKDASYLTEQMGSSGSTQYLAQAILNLTSAKGIKYVRIDFEMGSHASPDVWSRKDFDDFKLVQ